MAHPSAPRRDTLARWLSQIFHPYTLVAPAMVGTALLADVPPLSAIAWGLLPLPIAVGPLWLFVGRRVRRGTYTDHDISQRSQRRDAYLAALLGLAVLGALFWGLGAPPVFLACVLAALVAYSIGAVVNQAVTKISVHATAVGGVAAALFYFSPLWGSLFALAALATGWARVHLRHHTLLQVLSGWGVAALSVGLIFSLLL